MRNLLDSNYVICFVTVWPITGLWERSVGVGLIVFHKNIMRSFTGEFDKAGALSACNDRSELELRPTTTLAIAVTRSIGASAPANPPAKQLTNFLDKRQKIMRFIAAAGKKSIIDTKT